MLVNLEVDLSDPAPSLLAPPPSATWSGAVVERGPGLRRIRHAYDLTPTTGCCREPPASSCAGVVRQKSGRSKSRNHPR